MIKRLNHPPKHFEKEIKVLNSIGIDSWKRLKDLTDINLYKLVSRYNCSVNNLKKLRGVASLICELNIPQEEAALLIHSGIGSCSALAKYTPHELVNRAGRLERKLMTGRDPLINLRKASQLIDKAKSRQI